MEKTPVNVCQPMTDKGLAHSNKNMSSQQQRIWCPKCDEDHRGADARVGYVMKLPQGVSVWVYSFVKACEDVWTQ